MGWKDKIDEWASYPGKWWGLPVSILLKILKWLFFTDGGILVIFLFIALAVAVSLSCFYGIKIIRSEPEVARVVVLALGGVAGACGLVLAARRSTKFSEQVDTGQKQLFNEQLGRGAELLTRKEMVMRRTGIRVLEDLAETTIDNPDQVKFIMRIIHDFAHADTRLPLKDQEDLGTRIEKGKEKLDIALGIKTLVSLYDKSGKLDDFKELVQFRGCRLEGLIFSVAELQGADFTRAKLQGANFIGAELQGAHFMGAKLQGADFTDAELQGANFNGAKLQGADCTIANFPNAKNLKEGQIKGMIFHAEHQPTLPKGLEQFLDKRRGYEYKKDPDDKSNHRHFVKSDAEWSGRRVNEYLAEIGIINP